jgi:uncharacterized membrane protein
MLLLYGLLTLYALEIVLPLLALAIAYVTRRARRALYGPHSLVVSREPRADDLHVPLALFDKRRV